MQTTQVAVLPQMRAPNTKWFWQPLTSVAVLAQDSLPKDDAQRQAASTALRNLVLCVYVRNQSARSSNKMVVLK